MTSELTNKYLIVNPDAPLIDRSLKVKLRNGSFDSVNVFDYNLNLMCHQANPEGWHTVELDSGAHIQVQMLEPVFEGSK